MTNTRKGKERKGCQVSDSSSNQDTKKRPALGNQASGLSLHKVTVLALSLSFCIYQTSSAIYVSVIFGPHSSLMLMYIESASEEEILVFCWSNQHP